MREERSEALAIELRRRGLDTPALLLLEAHRPLRPLLANLAVFLSPLARPLLGRSVDRIQAALDDDDGYDRLIGQLEKEVDG
ncbi:MAG: hypothetical protein ABJC24_06095 [Chloroflexota bacterium]|jgi:hypothetical protein